MSQDTVGKVAIDLLSKNDVNDHSAEEQMREQLSDYEKGLWEAVDTGKKKYADSFYIVVLTKREKLLQNVIRNYFIPRLSCPSPEYDQSVFYYDYKNQRLEYIWSVPDKFSCFGIRMGYIELAPDESFLGQFVHDFYDQKLLEKAMARNKETIVKKDGKLMVPYIVKG